MFHFIRSRKGIFLISLAVILLLIFLSHLKLLRPVANLIFIGFKPPERIISRGTDKVVNFFDIITSIRDLHQENNKLKEENHKLLLENIRLKELKEENLFLRDQLNLKEEKGIIGIGAQVTSHNPDSLIQSIKIDKGTAQGVVVGAPVVFGEGFLIGRVIESYYNTAKVLLITDKNSVVNAMIVDSRATGNISGQHGLGLVMDLIPQTEVVKIGDEVITSGLSGELPKGLVIGEVIKVESAQSQLFQQAQVKPYVNFSQLEYVLVITTPAE